VTEAFEELPEQMREGDSRARSLERQVVDATEAFVLHRRVGETFPAAVVEAGDRSGTVVIDDPAVVARCDGEDLPVGEVIRARCTEADVARRTVRFERTG
jgi:exoribonuclease R